MLNVCCVKVGTKYGPEYVNILFDMVRRNLKAGLEGKFVCFTDDPSGLDPGIETRAVPADLTGWWAKLYLFAPEAFPEGERVLYFDLDVVITGWLDELAAYAGRFAILREFCDVPGFQSSIMAWRAGAMRHIWEWWNRDNRPLPAGGDQDWIEHCCGKVEILQDLFPNAFLSYKFHCLYQHPPAGTKVVVFHGEPKPDNCGEDWVHLIWKIGGGSGAELEMVCNTNDERLKSNIRSACERDLPWLQLADVHDGHAVIVGGAPSVKRCLDEIRWRKSIGQKIFALNNAFSYLREQGIEADAQVIVDAREENAKFVPSTSTAVHYIASQCHPAVFDAAKGLNTVLWHANNGILDEALVNPKKQTEVLISGGTTVGLSAMVIAHALGYRMLHLYGMDSSFEETAHHAYEQKLNDKDIVLDVVCQGRPFRASPWMVAQVNQFQELALILANDNATITVHGEGLLPWVAKHLESDTTPDTEIVEENGVFYPSKDRIIKTHGAAARLDVPRIVSRCRTKQVAVQAGGNVGLWPKELSKHFEKVITFEPDSLNFQCLELNCNGNARIERHNKALADEEKRVGLLRDVKNCGAHQVTEGNDIETATIDSLALPACDLIQLDIEGYELKALKGAERTIDAFKPVICVELKRLGEAFGIKDEETINWLQEKGYRQVERISRDYVFTAV